MTEYLKASTILHELQEAGRIQMEKDKPSVDDLLDRNIALMVNRIDLKINRAVEADEDVTYTSNACPSDRASLLRVYEAKVGDEQIAFSSSIWSLVNIRSRKILKAKELSMKNYTLAKYRNPFGDRKFKITEEEESRMEVLETFKVGREYMDDNGHMNNVKYLEHVEEWVPDLKEGRFLREIRLHFMKEALYDEEITIKRLRKEGAWYFRMYKASGEANFECEIFTS
jgi:acyl-ACP thioesterase